LFSLPTDEPSPTNICAHLSCDSCSHADSLHYNSIGDEGAKELAVALQTNTSLTSLK
jgi:hypothetical protein